MKIEKTIQDDHQVAINAIIDADVFETCKIRAAKRLSRNTKIPGFRPGKAPYPMIARHIGESTILEAALEILIDEVYPQVLEEADVTPYGPGQLQNVTSFDPPTLDFIVPLAPEAELWDYSQLDIPYELPTVTEEDIQREMENLQERQATIEPVERKSKIGDLVYISIDGKFANPEDKPEDQPTEFFTSQKKQPIVILKKGAKDNENEWPYEGFSNELKGFEKDAELTLTHEYPDDFEEKNLAGKAVEFIVKIEEVNSRALPELNDEFAKSLGDQYEALDDLKKEAEEHLATHLVNDYKSNYDNQILDAIVEGSTFKFPPQMREDEIDALVNQFKSQLAQQGMELETYLKTRQEDEQQLREQFSEMADDRIRRGLVLLEVANKEEIKVTEADVEEEVSGTLQLYQQYLDPKDAKKLLNDEFVRGLVTNSIRDKMTSATLDRLRTIAGKPEEIEEEAAEETEKEEKEEKEKKPAKKKTAKKATAKKVAAEPETEEAATEEQAEDSPENEPVEDEASTEDEQAPEEKK